jgi:ATP-binding cassette subfamily B protein
MGGQSTERSLDFRGSSRRLLRTLRPQRLLVGVSLLLAGVSVTLSVLGPRLLGDVTNLIFAGVIGSHLPAGVSQAQAIARLRHEGQTTQANLLSALHVVPGQGIDFGHIGQVLLLVLVVYVASSAGMLMQGRLTATIVQRLVLGLREQVQAKLSRLPLSYFDRQPRGEILSRVTNDIDNLAQSLQQTLSQLVISILTIIGVLTVMFVISPLLALIALVTVPVSVFAVARIGKRAQPHFVKQWSMTGKLNGHIEEMFTGHSLVTVFGQRKQGMDRFTGQNEALYQPDELRHRAPAVHHPRRGPHPGHGVRADRGAGDAPRAPGGRGRVCQAVRGAVRPGHGAGGLAAPAATPARVVGLSRRAGR